MSADGDTTAGTSESAGQPESSGVVEYLGYRIVLRRLAQDDSSRSSFLIRVLAAMSLWGMQEDLWEWRAYGDGVLLASDQELSRLAALEGARHWVRESAPAVSGDAGPV